MKKHTQQTLNDYFQFEESDLDANRLGLFSEKQKRELKSYKENARKSSVKVGVIAAGVGVLLLLLLIGNSLVGGLSFDLIDLLNNLPLLLVALAFLGIGIYSLLGGRKTNTDAFEHKVLHVQGPVDILEARRYISRYSKPHRIRTVYELRVGGKEFAAFEELPAVLTQGDVYLIHFDKADDEILSVEWVSKG